MFDCARIVHDATLAVCALGMRTRVRIRMYVGYIAHQRQAAVELLPGVWRASKLPARHGIINPLIAQEVFGEIPARAEKTIVWGE
jgi:hypothetical protein